MRDTILCGDALSMLKTIPSNHIQTCVTSPPYYALRDYGVEGQIGLESTPVEFVANLVSVFREVWRVLRDDGTLWVNIGDSYARGRIGRDDSGENGKFAGPRIDTRERSIVGIGEKNLLGMPWRLAFALQSDGWILRSEIIWHKPTAMPESVTDRPTKAHEQIFLLAKQPHYYYDADSIREPLKPKTFTTFGTHHRDRDDTSGLVKSDNWGKSIEERKPRLAPDGSIAGANKRSVWTVASYAYSAAHFATFPPKLIEPCILAGSRPGDIVLDPFMGAGTTALVALQHNRSYLGIELNPAYVELIKARIAEIQPELWSA